MMAALHVLSCWIIHWQAKYFLIDTLDQPQSRALVLSIAFCHSGQRGASRLPTLSAANDLLQLV